MFKECPLFQATDFTKNKNKKTVIQPYLSAGLEGVYQQECVHKTDVLLEYLNSGVFNRQFRALYQGSSACNTDEQGHLLLCTACPDSYLPRTACPIAIPRETLVRS